ncbi:MULTISPECIES: hypothetical protein [Pantoea]
MIAPVVSEVMLTLVIIGAL